MAVAFIGRVGEDVTLKSVAQGARDATTRWPALAYTDSSIKAIVQPLDSQPIEVGGIRASAVKAKIFTVSAIKVGDKIVHGAYTYTVSAPPHIYRRRGTVVYYSAVMERES